MMTRLQKPAKAPGGLRILAELGTELDGVFRSYQQDKRDSALLWRSALCVGLLGTFALGVLTELSRRETAPRGDDLIYERMAQHPFGTHTFPFAYRIGLPWLVHVLPFGHASSFELLAYVGAGGAAGFAFLLMCRLGTPGSLATGLALALAISPPMLVVALRGGRNTDAMTMLFMMAATLFIVERRVWALAVTLLLGVLFREAVLFIVPFAYAVWAARRWDKPAAQRTLLCGAPAILTFLALHLAIPSVGRASVPGYGGSLIGERFTVLESGLHSLFMEARRVFSVFGPLWLAAPFALANSRFARRGLVLVACSLLSMTFALDWGRMIFLSAPVCYPAGADTLTRHPRWRIPALIAFGVLILIYAIYMDRSGVQHGIVDNPPPLYPVR
jgi:hypothetical protein